MYKILGGDGQEYGPVSAATVREWILQGRVSGATQVRRADESAWQPLGSVPELAAHLPAAAVPIAAVTPTNSLAIWSLVLGILGFFCGITGPVGLVLGWMARKQIRAAHPPQEGAALALAGMITGGLSTLFILGYAIVMFVAFRHGFESSFSQARGRAQTINCVNNVKQLALALRIHAADNDDAFPAATNWCDAISAEVGGARNVFWCPSETNSLRSAYAFNAALGGLKDSDAAPDTVMLFESDAGWNASGGSELLVAQPRHNDVWVIGFADGSVQQINAARLATLRWNPTNEPPNQN